jgi:hypothetical protein
LKFVIPCFQCLEAAACDFSIPEVCWISFELVSHQILRTRPVALCSSQTFLCYCQGWDRFSRWVWGNGVIHFVFFVPLRDILPVGGVLLWGHGAEEECCEIFRRFVDLAVTNLNSDFVCASIGVCSITKLQIDFEVNLLSKKVIQSDDSFNHLGNRNSDLSISTT